MKSELITRTKAFAVSVVRLLPFFQAGLTAQVVAKQLLRAATAVAANYRSALRGKSKRDFIMKLNIAEEEADETCFWLELSCETGLVETSLIEPVLREAREITAILTKSGQTAKRNLAADS